MTNIHRFRFPRYEDLLPSPAFYRYFNMSQHFINILLVTVPIPHMVLLDLININWYRVRSRMGSVPTNTLVPVGTHGGIKLACLSTGFLPVLWLLPCSGGLVAGLLVGAAEAVVVVLVVCWSTGRK